MRKAPYVNVLPTLPGSAPCGLLAFVQIQRHTGTHGAKPQNIAGALGFRRSGDDIETRQQNEVTLQRFLICLKQHHVGAGQSDDWCGFNAVASARQRHDGQSAAAKHRMPPMNDLPDIVVPRFAPPRQEDRSAGGELFSKAIAEANDDVTRPHTQIA